MTGQGKLINWLNKQINMSNLSTSVSHKLTVFVLLRVFLESRNSPGTSLDALKTVNYLKIETHLREIWFTVSLVVSRKSHHGLDASRDQVYKQPRVNFKCQCIYHTRFSPDIPLSSVDCSLRLVPFVMIKTHSITISPPLGRIQHIFCGYNPVITIFFSFH